MSSTLETIAKELGISTATVSRALNNDRVIHAETRSKVLAVAARIGYQKPLRRGQRTIKIKPRLLLLIPTFSRNPANPVFNYYLQGMTATAGTLDCQLSIEEISEKQFGQLRQRNNLPRAIQSNDAHIVIIQGRQNPDDVATLSEIVPVVSLQWDHKNAQTDLVVAANWQGIADLVRYVVQKGHKKLAWIGGSFYDSSFFRERDAGFILGCRENNIPIESATFLTYNDLLHNSNLAKELVSKGVTAVLCSNDDAARKLHENCVILGVRVPEDLSITGFDAEPTPLGTGKKITSYDPCFVELGRAAVQVAIQRIREPSANRIIQSRFGQISEGNTVRDL